MKASKRTFSGTSRRSDLNEAIAEAIATAKRTIPTDYVEWKLLDISGKDGGFVLVHEIVVTIEVKRTRPVKAALRRD
jgi:hypothetical protein